MKHISSRLLATLMAVALVLTMLPVMTVAAAYENTHVNTGNMAEDIVAVAKTQLGYHEGSLAGTSSGSDNYTKYGVWYGNYVGDSSFGWGQWCAMFVSWCANQAGIPNDIVYYHAYCPYGVTWFKNQGRWQASAYQGGSYVPKRGDIIYFKNSQGIAGHIGIVDYVSGSTVYTLEGNTSSATYDPNGNVATDKSYALSSSYILGYGIPNYSNTPGASTAAKLGTYKITASSLNVRASASTSATIVGELKNGEIIEVTELSGGWGKVTLADGTTGWCAIGDYGDYIGVDALNTYIGAVWGSESLTMSRDTDGRVTLANSSSEPIAVDMPLWYKIGNKTTPYLNISVTVNKGGFYFGLTQSGTGYFMMRESQSGDELVQADSATFMTSSETLQIDIGQWWAPEEGYQIDTVRVYLNGGSSVTVNYCYFAEEANVVTTTAYNLCKGTGSTNPDTPVDPDPPVVDTPDPANLMIPSALAIVDRSKTGSYTYNNGMLTVVSGQDSGYDVVFNLNKTVDVKTLNRLLVSIDADVRFDIALTVTTTDGDRTFSLRNDFYPDFTSAPDGEYIPAMTGSRGLDFYSCYTWNKIAPADGNSTVKTVTVRVGGTGTVVINAIQLAANDTLTSFADGEYKTDSSTASVQNKTVLDSAVYPIEGGIVADVSVGTVAQMKSSLVSSYTLTVYENGGVVSDASAVKTGQTIKVTDGALTVATYTVAVYGDVNKDGAMTTADARELLLNIVGLVSLDTAQTLAGDMNGSGASESSDARDILLEIIGL